MYYISRLIFCNGALQRTVGSVRNQVSLIRDEVHSGLSMVEVIAQFEKLLEQLLAGLKSSTSIQDYKY